MYKKECALRASLGALALALAMPAHAQTDGQASQASGEISDIVVTAQRHEESLQRVPIAVTALSNVALKQVGVTDLLSVNRLAPGVQIQPFFKAGDAIYQIRGQVQTDASPTIDPSVGVYFDDVYIARSSGSLTNLLDVSRVEVLKGPQGTLFGKNTTGGAIRIISNQPTHDFEGYVSGGYESYDRYSLEGVLNVPLSETVAVRLAGQYKNKTGGYAYNTVTGRPMDRMEDISTRAALRWTPTDTVDIRLQGDYSHTKGGSSPAYLLGYDPRNSTFAALEVALESGLGFDFAKGNAILQGLSTVEGNKPITGADLRSTTGTAQGTSMTFNPATGQFTFVNAGSGDPETNLETWGLLANATIDLGFANLKSITAYRHAKSYYTYEVDGTQFHLLDALQTNNNSQFSQELILNGKALNNRLDWSVGALYYTEKAYQMNQPKVFAGLVSLQGGDGSYDVGTARNTSFGLFAQGTYNLTDQLSITAGARYTMDRRKAEQSAYNLFLAAPQTCLFAGFPGIASSPGFVPPCTLVSNKLFKNWAYTASINYQFDPDKLFYLRTSRSFRAGGFNSRITALPAYSSFQPEFVTDYEAGLKAIWFDRKLRTNIAVFYSHGSDVQTTVSQIDPTTLVSYNVTENIGTRNISGVEVDATAQITPNFSLDGGLAYMHGKSRNPTAPDVTFIIKTPEWSLNGGANLDVPISENYSARLHGDISYRGKMHDTQAPLRDSTTG
ncbi:MAG TPA: TonB-dependent receptor, partial [Novosphingobium sp.]